MIDRIWEHSTKTEKLEIKNLLERLSKKQKEWKPLPGPQTLALQSNADIVLYGGAAGGGKSYLAVGKALLQHRRVLILRREFPQLAGLLETAKEIYEPYGKYTATPQPTFRLNFQGKEKLIEFGSCQHDKDKSKYQGRAHDLRVLDEAANFLESQVDFLSGWIRSEDPLQKCQLLLLSNPPASSEGQWLFDWFAPWLDKSHPNPAMPGQLRYFAKINGKETELENDHKFVLVGAERIYDFDISEYSQDLIIVPKSRTFIPARVTDNPYYVESGYIATLQSLREPLRSQMLYGDFTAGKEDDAWQVIPTEWIKLAQKRWRETSAPNMPITALGVDVARGGDDKTVITIRRGNYVDKQIVYKGNATPDGNISGALVLKEMKNPCEVWIDVIGVGSSTYDYLKKHFEYNPYQQNNILGFNSCTAVSTTDKTGMFGFYNKRAEGYWKLAEALDPAAGMNICLPDDRELLADLCAARWEIRSGKIKIEDKQEITKRIGRSPDKADSAVYAYAIHEQPPTYGHLNVIGR